MEVSSSSGIRVDLDRLPIKRLEAIEEAGEEHFASEASDEESRMNAMIRRIDFSSFVAQKYADDFPSNKKAKKSTTTNSNKDRESSAAVTPTMPPWQGLVENLQSAHQELSVIIDLINTVEANDAVTVSGMQRPKPFPNEVLSDLAVSAATKLQRLQHLGRYFKQSSIVLEQQVAREARFYGSLIRLQQNWKVKRQHLAMTGPGGPGFTIDLVDNSIADLTPWYHSSSSTLRVDEDSAGMLAVQRPLKLCHSLRVGFLGIASSSKQMSFVGRKLYGSGEHLQEVKKDALTDEDVNQCINETHSTLREIHQSIFQEQVFDMVIRGTFYPSPGVNMAGIREDFLQLAIGQDTSLCLQLVSFGREDDPLMTDSAGQTQKGESGVPCSESLELMITDDKSGPFKRISLKPPNPLSLEIYLLHIFQEDILSKAKERRSATPRLHQVSGQPPGDRSNLLSHFCMAASHRIFSHKVLTELEHLVERVPYLQLVSHPTWNSRTSSWSLYLKLPQSILRSGEQNKLSDNHSVKSGVRSQFHTRVVVDNDKITVSVEGVPSIISSFRGSSTDLCSINSYSCDLEDLPMILLQQVASQVIHWLHKEALVVGMKTSRDFLCLYFTLDLGETLALVAHIDPDGNQGGCISWLVVLDHGSMEGQSAADTGGGSEHRRFLGHVSLQALYSILMDLVSLCNAGSGSH